ncbi:hypothetical protein SIAM614_13008 [Stappia aggregata IAM 12614]|uniref:Uncharacterized protein n=1 Tax=Roseibium aggregatum (strain ATCC 25650 / DSM 13394 / JCM 20685 / NBRC 16684 / NCIMB 2208 / IAM 12614 / B1) TaxID=384765 RepID=A0NQ77_ROSAI|nr:hypothetical protein SIAM614_13008 [Stappia aggregata IAM 12614] [Roseibium aggregatum IAM 12614]
MCTLDRIDSYAQLFDCIDQTLI